MIMFCSDHGIYTSGTVSFGSLLRTLCHQIAEIYANIFRTLGMCDRRPLRWIFYLHSTCHRLPLSLQELSDTASFKQNLRTLLF